MNNPKLESFKRKVNRRQWAKPALITLGLSALPAQAQSTSGSHPPSNCPEHYNWFNLFRRVHRGR